MPRSLQDLSSLTRDRTIPPEVEACSFDHWTTREVPPYAFLNLPSSGSVVSHGNRLSSHLQAFARISFVPGHPTRLSLA